MPSALAIAAHPDDIEFVMAGTLLLLHAAGSNPVVLQDPKPIVLFKQFGTTSMDFELHFWLRLSNDMQVAIAQSDVREAVNELFEKCDTQAIIAAAPLFGTATSAPPTKNAA